MAYGLSGKKLVVGRSVPGVPIGGGALYGKDPHKADRRCALQALELTIAEVRAGAKGVTEGYAERSDHSTMSHWQWHERSRCNGFSLLPQNQNLSGRNLELQ